MNYIKNFKLTDGDFFSEIDSADISEVSNAVLSFSSYIYANYWNLFNLIYDCDFYPEHTVESMKEYLLSENIDSEEAEFADAYFSLTLIRSLGHQDNLVEIEHYSIWRNDIWTLQTLLAVDMVNAMVEDKGEGNISILEPFAD